MADLFKEILPSILQTKQNCMLTEQDERQYPHFMVNRALSYHVDTVLMANEINMLPHADNRLKYDFLLNIIKPYRRPFQKWEKRVEPVDLAVVKEYYGYSDAKALEVLSILDDEQINHLRQRIYKGD
jgi:hypothetical protein